MAASNFPIKKLVVHCSATKPSQKVDVNVIDKWHKQRGFTQVGYHYVILRDGTVQLGRPPTMIGAHASGNNKGSLGICLVGGLNESTGKPENNYTPVQMESLGTLLDYLEGLYPKAYVLGHRDLSPDLNGDGKITSNEWTKACPCFDAATWWSGFKSQNIK